MKSELNDYKITNGDGIIKCNNEGKIRFDNDNPHYIKENSLSNLDETFNENESFGLEKKDNAKKQNTSNDITKTTSSTSATTSAATSSTASSAISSGLGSLIGGVTASIATAIMVVVAFVSIMTINISLVMASVNSLVFQVEINNAQKEDFEKPVYAILKGDGYSQTQELSMDSVYITFDDLESGKEYVITIKNDEKVFVEKSYFTATKDIQRGFIEAWNEEGTISALVNVRELKSDEFYTFTATSSSGKVLFKNSDVKQEKEYSFDIESSDTISFTLSINGKVCCFEQLEVQLKSIDDDISGEDDDPTVTQEHNYIPRGFVWEYNEQGQLVAFGEGVCSECEDVLRLPTELTRDGEYITASIIYNGTKYTDNRVEIDLTGKETEITEDACYFIKATNYVFGNSDSDNTIRYSNDSEHPYIITGTAQQISNCINLYNSGLSILNVGYKSDYYFEFNNLNIVADSDTNSTIFKLQTKYDVTIHIAIRGDVYFETTNAPSFNIMNDGEDDVTVTFDITFVDENSSFSCYDNYIDMANIYAEQQNTTIIFNINGVQVDPNGEEVGQDEPVSEDEDAEISLNDGQIHINANGYARQESDLSNPTEFVSSFDNPYLIQNQEIYGCDNIINVYQNDSSIQTADIYIKLKDVTIQASSWCSLFRIVATNTLYIHLIIEGNVNFVGGQGQQIFSSQGTNSPTVSIIIDQTSLGGTFNADDSNGLTYAQSGTINVRLI